MRLSGRGPGVPPEVRAAVDGRVLAAARASDGTWLVGTRDALHVVGRERGESFAWPWQEVQRADWDSEGSTLRIEQVTDYGRPVTLVSFVLDEPGSLLPLVRERVTASVVLERRVKVGRRQGFTVIGRRAPSGLGQVRFAYQFDVGVDPDDPLVRAAAEQALEDARESLGL
jgi:hypothetical protein